MLNQAYWISKKS